MTGQILKEIRSFNRISQEQFARYCGYANRSSIYRLELMPIAPIRYFVLLGEMLGISLSTEDEINNLYTRMKGIEDAGIMEAVTVDWRKAFDPPHQHHTYYSLMQKVYEVYGEFNRNEFDKQLESAMRSRILKSFWLSGVKKYLLLEAESNE